MCEDNIQVADGDVQEKERLLHALVGEHLATGLANDEILELLQTEQHLSVEEARVILRGVYDSWSSVREGLNLQAEDDKNWHQYLRMQLLQSAIRDETIPSQRLALQILDSLATIQGISTTIALTAPLSIEMIEKKPEPEATGEQTNG